jgi:hypothetical protein
MRIIVCIQMNSLPRWSDRHRRRVRRWNGSTGLVLAAPLDDVCKTEFGKLSNGG